MPPGPDQPPSSSHWRRRSPGSANHPDVRGDLLEGGGHRLVREDHQGQCDHRGPGGGSQAGGARRDGLLRQLPSVLGSDARCEHGHRRRDQRGTHQDLPPGGDHVRQLGQEAVTAVPLRGDQPRRGDGRCQGPGYQAPGPQREHCGGHPAAHRGQSAHQEQRPEHEEGEDRAEPDLHRRGVQREVAGTAESGRVPDPAGHRGAGLNRARRVIRPRGEPTLELGGGLASDHVGGAQQVQRVRTRPAHHNSAVNNSPPASASIAARRYVICCPRIGRVSRNIPRPWEVTGHWPQADHGRTQARPGDGGNGASWKPRAAGKSAALALHGEPTKYGFQGDGMRADSAVDPQIRIE